MSTWDLCDLWHFREIFKEISRNFKRKILKTRVKKKLCTATAFYFKFSLNLFLLFQKNCMYKEILRELDRIFTCDEMESSFVMFLFFFSGLSLAQPMVQLKAVTQKLRAFVSPSLGSSLSSANSCPKLPDIGCTLISSQRIKLQRLNSF